MWSMLPLFEIDLRTFWNARSHFLRFIFMMTVIFWKPLKGGG
jgi:hypothetical protein